MYLLKNQYVVKYLAKECFQKSYLEYLVPVPMKSS